MVSNLERDRVSLATRTRQLRLERGWTQSSLAARLGLSQNRLSEIERGAGSFTAEQFLELLRAFNATLDDFVRVARSGDAALQNVLSNLGASHLRESDDVLASAALRGVEAAAREVLVSPKSSRLVAALAPVLVRNVDQLNLHRLQAWLVEVALPRRLPWLLENVLEAIASDEDAPKRVQRTYARAKLVLQTFLDQVPSPTAGGVDLLEPGVRSDATLAELLATRSSVSARWQVISRLQSADFLSALQAARSHD